MASVGLVGGLGPESTIDYYRRILDGWARQQPGSAPAIVIDSLDVQRALRLVADNRAALTDYLLAAIRRLAAAGVDFVAITANTPHIVFDDLAARSPVPLLSIVNVCARAASRRGLRRLVLLGTRFTMAAPFYAAGCAPYGIELVSLAEAEIAWMHERYVNELLNGVFRDATRDAVAALVDRVRERDRIDGVILGGTELPLLIRAEAVAGLPALDTAALHVEAILERLRQDVEIRRATAADAALLTAIGAETFQDTFAADNRAADMALYLAQAFNPARQAQEVGDPASLFLIAEVAGEPAGYARLTWADAPAAVVGHRPMEISRFYVRRPWIGRAVGAALMRACLAAAEQADGDVVWLAVWERNRRALAFYRRWGFSLVGEQAFVLGTDRQRDLLMSKPWGPASLPAAATRIPRHPGRNLS